MMVLASISFKSDGNVGIGTTNPLNKLEVIGTTSLNGSLYVNGTVVSSGDVIAYYSDERLKNIKSYIKDVLPTLDEINVFKYNSNDLGESFGMIKIRTKLV